MTKSRGEYQLPIVTIPEYVMMADRLHTGVPMTAHFFRQDQQQTPNATPRPPDVPVHQVGLTVDGFAVSVSLLPLGIAQERLIEMNQHQRLVARVGNDPAPRSFDRRTSTNQAPVVPGFNGRRVD